MLNDIHLDFTPRTGNLGTYGADAFRLVLVNTDALDELWMLLINTWHFLKVEKIVGPRVKYLIYLKNQPVGALSYTAGGLRLRPRDGYIGMTKENRKGFLPHCLSQHRFLLLPWIEVKFLASHIVNRSLNAVATDWPAKYGVEPWVCTTFVDSNRNKGTCYRAAGWLEVGLTEGYGWEHRKMVFHGNRKYVFLKVMNQRCIAEFHQQVLVAQ